MRLFSSYSKSVTNVHFDWMETYGIDGVFIQRFVSECLYGPNLDKDIILKNAVAAAERTGRVISLMYDISGASEELWATAILNDWKHVVEDFHVTNSSSWMQHEEKPVLAIWGMGFTDHPGTVESSLALLSDLRQYMKITFLGGVPTHWRNSSGDSKPGFESLYSSMDVVSPWLVGRFGSNDAFDQYMTDTFLEDVKFAKAGGNGYAPVVFPGFSWSNLQRTNGGEAEFNQIPRNGGEFWSHQVEAWQAFEDDEVLFIYGAMFDEVDEGTAMFKCVSKLEDTRSSPGQFLYYSVDGVDVKEDFYLELAGNYTKNWQN